MWGTYKRGGVNFRMHVVVTFLPDMIMFLLTFILEENQNMEVDHFCTSTKI